MNGELDWPCHAAAPTGLALGPACRDALAQYLPTAQDHYDMNYELVWPGPATTPVVHTFCDDSGPAATFFEESWVFEGPPMAAPDTLYGLVYTTDAELVHLASALLTFFGEPRAAVGAEADLARARRPRVVRARAAAAVPAARATAA